MLRRQFGSIMDLNRKKTENLKIYTNQFTQFAITK